ncbi:hypothetical protein R1flu_027643, partial [Riccia fluitans]
MGVSRFSEILSARSNARNSLLGSVHNPALSNTIERNRVFTVFADGPSEKSPEK